MQEEGVALEGLPIPRSRVHDAQVNLGHEILDADTCDRFRRIPSAEDINRPQKKRLTYR